MVKPTDIPRWQAAKPSPRATWVLPVPLFPTAMTFSRRWMYSQRASSSTRDLFSDGMAGKSKVSRLFTAGNRAARMRRSTRARRRFVDEGLEAAINDRPRPGRERKLSGRQEAHLVAIACSSPPEGHVSWTLHLLADKVVELEFAGSISLETVRQILKKTNSSRGRRKSGASPR